MEEKPICDFPKLKKALINKGYCIGKAEPWREINSEEVRLKDGKLEFNDDGIFIDDNGAKRQVFLYKRRYKLRQYGTPKYHVCKCSIIEKFLVNDRDIPEYRSANVGTVKVLNWDNFYREEEVSNLPLCKNCAAKLYINSNVDSSEFAEILRNAVAENEPPKPKIEVNVNGYTKDWQLISSEFRKQHNYTCEKCGVQVTPFESEFMHVHHKNKNKTDNSSNNLQCLCIKCHSEIDATHIHNFSTGGQRLLIKLFMEKYKNNRLKP